MTLQEWIDSGQKNANMVGLTFRLPEERVGGYGGPKQEEMVLKSAWQMGSTPGGNKLGLWFMLPEEYPEGRVYPLFDVDFADMCTWEVVV